LAERFVNGSSERVDLGVVSSFPQDISPDGKQFLTAVLNEGVFASRLEGSEAERLPHALLAEGELGRGPGFSPDGRWIVYTSRSRGSQPAGSFVQAFPGPGLRTQIAPVKGVPIWRKDGREIVIADEESLWSVSVSEAAGALRFGAPELLFSTLRWPAGSTLQSRPLAVSRDGSRIYFVQGLEQPGSGVIHVRMGWASK